MRARVSWSAAALLRSRALARTCARSGRARTVFGDQSASRRREAKLRTPRNCCAVRIGTKRSDFTPAASEAARSAAASGGRSATRGTWTTSCRRIRSRDHANSSAWIGCRSGAPSPSTRQLAVGREARAVLRGKPERHRVRLEEAAERREGPADLGVDLPVGGAHERVRGRHHEVLEGRAPLEGRLGGRETSHGRPVSCGAQAAPFFGPGFWAPSSGLCAGRPGMGVG